MQRVLSRRRLWVEVVVVLAVTFGMSALRAIFRLIDALLSPTRLADQSVTLQSPLSRNLWLDLALQLCSSVSLFAWGALALLLLNQGLSFPKVRDWGWGAGLAAAIGVPGLLFYCVSLQLNLSKQVIPVAFNNPWWEIPVSLLWSGANAFSEEIVVVLWLCTRLQQLGLRPIAVVATSATLRGAYHLYQGISAGFGNIVMGVVFVWFYQRTGKIWPLILAHFLIDAVAFVGYSALGEHLSWLRV